MRALVAALLLCLLAVSASGQTTPLSGALADSGGMSPLTAGTTYLVTGDISVTTGMTLTIPAGVVIKMTAARSFIVNGTLICGSTGGAPVVFTSDTDDSVGGDATPGTATTGTAGHWRRISLSANSDASVIENTVVRFAGNSGFNALVLNNSDCTLTDCTVENSQFTAMTLSNNSFPTVSGCSFTGNGGLAVDFVPLEAVPGFTNNTSSGNTTLDELRVGTGGFTGSLNLGPTNTMNGSGVLVLSADASIAAGDTMSLAAGTTIKWEGPRSLICSGTLLTNGTAGNRVTFTSLQDDSVGGDTNKDGPSTGGPGNWRRIRFTGSSDASTLTQTVLRNGGNSGFPCIELTLADITMQSCRIESAQFDAIDLSNNSFPTITGCQFVGNGARCIDNVALGAVQNFSGNDATGNAALNEILVASAAVTAGTTVNINPSMTMGGRGVLVITVDVSVNPTGTLRFGAGMIIKWDGARSLIADGTTECTGSITEPVVFTTLTDDTEGGDTNLDGGASLPTPGSWRRIRLTNGADASVFTNTRLKWAGGSGFTAMELINADITMAACTISTAQFHGITLSNTSLPTITGCAVNDCGGTAMIGVTWTALPGLTFNSASGNAGGNYIDISANSISGSPQVFPYNYPGDVLVVSGDLAISGTANLILEAGVTVKMVGARTISTGSSGTLTIRGTGLQPVIFTTSTDDSVGGDTNLDGGTTTPTPGSWRRISIATNSGPCNIQHCILRYAGGSGFTAFSCSEASAVLNAIRVDLCQLDGFALTTAASPVSNLVAWGCGGDGIDCNSVGTFDLVHATAAECGGFGIQAGVSHMGFARNCNSFGNSSGNYNGWMMGSLTFCNGDATQAGSFGNTNVDPLFEDPMMGDLHLQAGSPSIDAADATVAASLITDHDDNSRIADDDLDGTAGADQGAYERVAYTLSAVGDPLIGGTVTFTAQGATPGNALYFAGVLDGSAFFDPFGFVSVGSVPTIATFLILPTGVSLPIPLNLPPAASGIRFGIQALVATAADPAIGNFTNRYVGVLF